MIKKGFIKLIFLVSLDVSAGISISGSSDSAYIDKGKEQMVLDGDVKISFDQGTINADHVKIKRSDNIVDLHAQANDDKLVIFNINGASGQAKVLNYNEKTGLLELVGDAKLNDGINNISSKKIEYKTK